eukprot:TRINITY_DN1088_c0_g1_i6.p1 TRINITY_DN1088_c0_g1~~TRINITY_DN1088_c0_g1_i6.p1  ORF type:complete len:2413 (+),score=944.25 TRINITY_DN1088_c0_g1_i6:3-7241(+)
MSLPNITDEKWDFTGYFIEMKEKLKSDSTNCLDYLKVFNSYFENNALFSEDFQINTSHKNYVLNEALPDLCNAMMDRYYFHSKEQVEQFIKFEELIIKILDFIVLTIPEENPKTISLLTIIFDASKYFYRDHNELQSYIKDLTKKYEGKSYAYGKKNSMYGDVEHKLLIHNINLFGNKGGFTQLMELLQKGPVKNFSFVKAILDLMSKLRIFVSRDNELDLFISNLPEVIFKVQLLNLEHKDLRRVEKKEVEEIDHAMRNLLSSSYKYSNKEAETLCTKFCFDFSLKCLKSDIQDKKFNGLKYIEDAIDKLASEKAYAERPPVNPRDVINYLEKTRELLDWVENENIVDTIFEESNLRQELIIRSRKIVRFLAQEGELKPAHIARVLQAIQENQHDRNKDIKNALYDTLIESTPFMSRKVLSDLIWKNLRVMEKKTFSPNTILLINSLLKLTKDDSLLIELTQSIWELVFEDSNIPRDTHEKAIEKIIDISKSRGFNFQADCIRQIENNQSSSSFIRLLMELMESQGESKGNYANKLVSLNLPNKILENFSLYKSLAKQELSEKKKNGMIGTNEDPSDVCLVGIYTHLENVKNRLKFIEKMISHSKNYFDNESLQKVWDILFLNCLTKREKDVCIEWIVEIAKNSDQLSFLFKNFFCDSKNNAGLFDTETSFNTFLRTFCTINNNKANMRSSVSTNPNNFDFKVIDIKMVGYEEIWNVVLEVKEEMLFKRGFTFLMDLHLKLDKIYEDSTNKVRSLFCKSAIERLKLFSQKLQSKDSLSKEDSSSSSSPSSSSSSSSSPYLLQCNRLLGILKEFIDVTEVKSKVSSSSSDSSSSGNNDENKAPPPRPETNDQKEKVMQFLEMVGPDSIPEKHKMTISTLILKDNDWDFQKVVENVIFSGDLEMFVSMKLTECDQYRESEEVKKEEVFEGKAASEILSENNENYTLLFEMLDIDALDQEFIWQIIRMVKPNETLLLKLKEINDNPENKIDWGKLIGTKPNYRLLYSLQLIDHFIPSPLSSSLENSQKSLWCKHFIISGGFSYLFSLLSYSSKEKELNSCKRDCLLFLLQIVYHFLKGQLYEKDKFPPWLPSSSNNKTNNSSSNNNTPSPSPSVLRENNDTNISEKEDKSPLNNNNNYNNNNGSNKNELKEPILVFDNQTSQILISETPFDKFPEIMFNLVVSRSEEIKREVGLNKMRTEEAKKQESKIVEYSIYLLVGSLIRTPSLLNSLYSIPLFDSLLLSVLHCPDPSIRHEFTWRLSDLSNKFVNSPSNGAKEIPAKYLMRLLLENLPTTEAVSHDCEHFFILLNEEMKYLGEEEVKKICLLFPQKFVENKKIGNPLLSFSIHWLKQRKAVEKTVFDKPDQVTSGYLFLIYHLLKSSNDPQLKKYIGTSEGENMVKEILFGCLFGTSGSLTETSEMKKSMGIDVSKCKTRETRKWAFEVLSQLTSNCEQNFETVVHFIASRHLNRPSKTTWDVQQEQYEKSTKFVGIRNLGATCYMNSVTQQLFMMEPLRNAILNAESVEDEKDMFYQFQRLMGFLLKSDAQYFDSEPFCKTFPDINGNGFMNVRRQEDAFEFFNRLQEKIEESVKGTPHEKAFSELLTVETEGQIYCQGLAIGKPHTKYSTQTTKDPIVQLEFAPNIEGAFSTAYNLNGEPVTDYRCESCDSKVTVIKRAALVSVSNHLVVMLKRFQWDFFDNNARKKIHDKFDITQRVNLKKFTKEGLEIKEKGGEVLDDEDWEFELSGILVHSGKTMDSGHYYSIIKSKEDGQWYKFDDRRVTPFPQEALKEGHELFIGEVYMLFFEKKKKIEKGVFSTSLFYNQPSQDIKVSSSITKDISRFNSEMLQKRQFHEPEYLFFIFNLILHSPFLSSSSSLSSSLSSLPPPSLDSSSLDSSSLLDPSSSSSSSSDSSSSNPEEGEKKEKRSKEPRKMIIVSNDKEKNRKEYKRYEKGDEEKDVSLKSCMLSFFFVFETVIVNKNAQLFKNWKDVLISIFSESPSACGWVLHLLSTSRRDKLLKHCLIESNERWLREGFSEFLSACLKVLAPYEYELFPRNVNYKDDSKFFEYLEKKKKRESDLEEKLEKGLIESMAEEETHPEEEEQKKRAISVSFVNYLLSLMEYVRRYWNQFHQYFSVINNYCRQGQPERLHLSLCTIPTPHCSPLRFIALWIDWYMGSLSPKSGYGRTQLGTYSENAKLVEYFRCFEGVLLTMRTKSKTRPPTSLGDENPEMDEDSSRFFNNKEMFTSLIKQSYDLETNKSIVKHWSYNDEDKSRWIIEVCLNAFSYSFREDKPKYPLNIATLLKTIVSEVNDDYVQLRITLIFKNSYGCFFSILDNNTHKSPTVFQAIGVITSLLPDDNNAGHELVTAYFYNMKDDLKWILNFLQKNSTLPMFDSIFKKWTLLLEGKLHKEGVWKD